jgi:two-component system sensor histidine kinase CpxA
MMLRFRSLYVKIFLWFCATAVISTALVVLIASVAGSQPFGRRWMAVTQDLYAHSAIDFYTSGGAPALTRYLSSLARHGAIEGYLLDAAGHDVLGAPFPEHMLGVYERSQRTGRSASSLGRYWTAASPVQDSNGRRYVFVMEAHPDRGFLDGTFSMSFAPRLLGGIVLAALLCLLLARHITQPIRLLEAAASRLAVGDMSVRTRPALAGRNDELASMAAAFDSMAERIESLLQTQRQMLADISHELRSPLTRIGVSLELLRRGETDVVEPMQADLDRLNEMIGQVLELTRLDLQESVSPLGTVDLASVLEDIVERANYEGRGEGKTVMLHLETKDCILRGEQSALRSCLENIVRNALQCSPAAGLIRIKLRPLRENWIEIRVDDNGPGVPEESLPHLFAPFFRVAATAAAHPFGSGLGLSISARVVAGYGGTISATNRPPNGLSIQLTLPCISV